MIEISGVATRIGKLQILSNITLGVPAGKLVSIVGANGAGKTTLLRTISRLLPVAAGSVRFEGHDLAALQPQRVAELGLVHVPQGRQIVPNLTVEDNLLIGARHVRSLSAAVIAQRLALEYQRFPVLSERRHVAGSSLSGGEQQMLAISRALMMKPKALMLDEPSLGLAPRIVALIMETLQALRDGGTTVLLVEQAAMLALGIADFGYVMKNGRVAMSGAARDLLADRMLVQSYLS
ncbi:ABC transporter ATP-binding protein [Reyranella sp.]|jgi:branched-chain amino acid transport system ATP-binding protein|uniref:ABC transporter ATP-binding protein n=1 Tax=Reyranella sp. TaxID=1929291 RepID=UPI00086BD8BB|nr:ABC transporter ATP-binding protein [Reyranella sp.]ODT21819.1 MAG: hypothetical protein ABS35_16360 [Kaistia sp. SCN 65-12]TAJ81346.1 MAG: ABC transporter ATP-binding protein [Reyranella sp.]